MEISTPGRICLFGEHQDYLGLPVIAMAISLRAKIIGEKRSDNQVIIYKPNLGETETFSLDAPPPTSKKLAGSFPYNLIISMVAIANPAPLTIQPILPSSFM